jgi:hypothetical protein
VSKGSLDNQRPAVALHTVVALFARLDGAQRAIAIWMIRRFRHASLYVGFTEDRQNVRSRDLPIAQMSALSVKSVTAFGEC